MAWKKIIRAPRLLNFIFNEKLGVGTNSYIFLIRVPKDYIYVTNREDFYLKKWVGNPLVYQAILGDGQFSWGHNGVNFYDG